VQSLRKRFALEIDRVRSVFQQAAAPFALGRISPLSFSLSSFLRAFRAVVTRSRSRAPKRASVYRAPAIPRGKHVARSSSRAIARCGAYLKEKRSTRVDRDLSPSSANSAIPNRVPGRQEKEGGGKREERRGNTYFSREPPLRRAFRRARSGSESIEQKSGRALRNRRLRYIALDRGEAPAARDSLVLADYAAIKVPGKARATTGREGGRGSSPAARWPRASKTMRELSRRDTFT